MEPTMMMRSTAKAAALLTLGGLNSTLRSKYLLLKRHPLRKEVGGEINLPEQGG